MSVPQQLVVLSDGTRFQLLDDGSIYCEEKRHWSQETGGFEIRVHPLDSEWDEFLRTLDEAKVWDWEEEYMSDHINIGGGSGWSVDIRYPDRSVSSSGNSESPDGFGKVWNKLRWLCGIVNELAAPTAEEIGQCKLSSRQMEVALVHYGYDDRCGGTMEEIGAHFGLLHGEIREIKIDVFRQIKTLRHRENARRYS